MTSVAVPLEQFRAGDFPRVCALTGAPATTDRRLLVIRGGVLGDAVGRRRRMAGTAPSRVSGLIPLSEPAARRTALLERVRGVLSVVALVGFVAGLFTSLPLLLGASALAVLLGVSLLFSVGGELDRAGATVTLLHVHPEFVTALAEHPRSAG